MPDREIQRLSSVHLTSQYELGKLSPVDGFNKGYIKVFWLCALQKMSAEWLPERERSRILNLLAAVPDAEPGSQHWFRLSIPVTEIRSLSPLLTWINNSLQYHRIRSHDQLDSNSSQSSSRKEKFAFEFLPTILTPIVGLGAEFGLFSCTDNDVWTDRLCLIREKACDFNEQPHPNEWSSYCED